MDEVKLFEKLDKIIELLEVQIAMDENFDWMMGEPGKPISRETVRAWVEAKKKVLKDS